MVELFKKCIMDNIKNMLNTSPQVGQRGRRNWTPEGGAVGQPAAERMDTPI